MALPGDLKQHVRMAPHLSRLACSAAGRCLVAGRLRVHLEPESSVQISLQTQMLSVNIAAKD